MGLVADLARAKENYKTRLKYWDSNQDYHNYVNILKSRGAVETPVQGKVAFIKSDYYPCGLGCSIIILQDSEDGKFYLTGYDHMRFEAELILDYDKAVEYCGELDKAMEYRKVNLQAINDTFARELGKIKYQYQHRGES